MFVIGPEDFEQVQEIQELARLHLCYTDGEIAFGNQGHCMTSYSLDTPQAWLDDEWNVWSVHRQISPNVEVVRLTRTQFPQEVITETELSDGTTMPLVLTYRVTTEMSVVSRGIQAMLLCTACLSPVLAPRDTTAIPADDVRENMIQIAREINPDAPNPTSTLLGVMVQNLTEGITAPRVEIGKIAF